MKRYITLLLVLVMCIPMMLPSVMPVSAATGESISLMTYNVCAFGVNANEAEIPNSSMTIAGRAQSVLSLMYMPDGSDPDVICLQEVNNTWGQYLIDGLVTARGYTAYGYSSNGISSMIRGAGQWDLFNMIFFKTDKYKVAARGKFWCSDTPSTKSLYSGGDFERCINYLKLQSKETGRQFFVTSAHIDAKSSSVRQKSTKQIATTMNSLAEGLPVIMMGDWNSKSSSTEYKNITNNGFNDALNIATSKSTSSTYVGWISGSSSVIDHCFLSKNLFTVSQYKVITTKMSNGYTPSDHRPVAIEAMITSVAPSPTPIPTAKPTASPTPKPTATPTVAPTATPIPEPVDNFELESESSYIRDKDNLFITGVKKGTAADDFLFNFKNLDLIIKKNGNEITGSTVVGTGTVITDGTTEYQVVVRGDVNGDGAVSTNDYLLIKRNISTNTLNAVKHKAADIDGNGTLATTDYLRVKRNIAGNYEL